jgi:hypothetical protein
MRKPRYAIWFGKLEDSDRGCARIEIYTSAPRQAEKGHGVNEYANVKKGSCPLYSPYKSRVEDWRGIS